MPIRSASHIHFFQFESFTRLPVVHAIFTREGGVSPAPWDSLNVGGTVGDEPGRVHANHQRALDALQRPMGSLFDVWQVHSAEYVQAQQPRGEDPHAKADILITANPEVTLFMRFADCVPIMLVDPVNKAVAIAHAGWLGTARGAAGAAVAALHENFGSRPEDLYAGLGPSIGPDHYEVGPDVLARFRQAFSGQAEAHFLKRNGSLYLDLWSANQAQLHTAGVENIETARICTACDLRRWFSHRAEKGKTGRFGALIALNI
ncbi:MAG: peptidoglycan editing factor PgeF [Anaerolineales bacterium]|nr:peptidoglycan editing factor PgeF [Anaerolineales bacterium]